MKQYKVSRFLTGIHTLLEFSLVTWDGFTSTRNKKTFFGKIPLKQVFRVNQTPSRSFGFVLSNSRKLRQVGWSIPQPLCQKGIYIGRHFCIVQLRTTRMFLKVGLKRQCWSLARGYYLGSTGYLKAVNRVIIEQKNCHSPLPAVIALNAITIKFALMNYFE